MVQPGFLFWKQNQVDHFIFTDSDIAVIYDLGDVVENYPDFHIGLTFENIKDQPLNSGFILVRATDEAVSKAEAFLEEVLVGYKSMFMKAAHMLGDQLALAWIVKNQPLLMPNDLGIVKLLLPKFIDHKSKDQNLL